MRNENVSNGRTIEAELTQPVAAAPASPTREYIYSGGQLVATIAGASTTYQHADHLSVRLNTNTSGQKIGEQGHYPYGEQWYAVNTTTKFFFTTYERDSQSGLDYAMARYYISRFGRYCSMDPVGGSVGDPQSWNRYAYARNNPANITDPSGMIWGWLKTLFKALGKFFKGSYISKPKGNPPEVWSEQRPQGPASGPIPPGMISDGGGWFANGFMESGSTPMMTQDMAANYIGQIRDLLVHSLLTDTDCLSFLHTSGSDVIKTMKTIPIKYGPLSSGDTSESTAAETTVVSSTTPYSPVPASAEITVNENGYFFRKGAQVDGGVQQELYEPAPSGSKV